MTYVYAQGGMPVRYYVCSLCDAKREATHCRIRHMRNGPVPYTEIQYACDAHAQFDDHGIWVPIVMVEWKMENPS